MRPAILVCGGGASSPSGTATAFGMFGTDGPAAIRGSLSVPFMSPTYRCSRRLHMGGSGFLQIRQIVTGHDRPRTTLLDCDRLGEITRLVDVGAHHHCRVIGDELHRDGVDQ